MISIDNQHCLTNTRISYPMQHRRDAAAAKIVTRAMVPKADAYLLTSFFAAPIKKRRTFLFPPILRDQVLRITPTEADHVLLYVTSPAPQLAELLSSIRCKFVAYGFGREGQEGSFLYKKPGMDTFVKDLSSAKAVIANAGFSLLSEALHLGKPYLAIPVKHQFEQIFNDNGVCRDDAVKLITEGEHLHSTDPCHMEAFEQLCYRLGVGEAAERVSW